jgi:hypothetical protein
MMMNNEIDGDMEELSGQPRVETPESDLTLLKRAAHAIGAVRVEVVVGEGYVNLHFADGSVVHSWNPLMFSGDAFELIAKLQMQVDYFARGHRETGGVNVQCGPNILIYEPKLGDVAAATRRAVTRAAGEMAN